MPVSTANNELRQKAVALACYCLGALLAWGLYALTAQRPAPVRPVKMVAKFTVAKPLEEVSIQKTEPKSDAAPTAPPKEKPRKKAPPRLPLLTAEAPIPLSSLPNLAQPEPLPVKEANPDELPPLDAPAAVAAGAASSASAPLAAAPPASSASMPEFVLSKVEKPGGKILVLGLKLNDQGRVVDVVQVVPSAYTLSDIAVSLAYMGQFWTHLSPPLVPGEERWLEIRIDQAAANARQIQLP